MSEAAIFQSLMQSIESVGGAVKNCSESIEIIANRLRELNERVSKLELLVALSEARERDDKSPAPLAKAEPDLEVADDKG